LLCEDLSDALRTQPAERYRVAIWEVRDDEPDAFIGLGWGGFDVNDEAVTKLDKADSIAAITLSPQEREYYCRDIDKDPRYVAHSGRRKRYGSIYAVALGTLDKPWGVLTVDARGANGFSTTDITIIQRFAALVSVGYAALREPWTSAEVASIGPE
jgi:hypothetical protein